MLRRIAAFGSQSGGKFRIVATTVHFRARYEYYTPLHIGFRLKYVAMSHHKVPLGMLIREGPKPRGATVHPFRWTMNRIFLRGFGFWWKLGRIRCSTISFRQERKAVKLITTRC